MRLQTSDGAGDADPATPTPASGGQARRCGCYFVPPRLLDHLASGRKLQPRDTHLFRRTLQQTNDLGAVRSALQLGTIPPETIVPAAVLQSSPAQLFNCDFGTALPGRPLDFAAQAGTGGEAIAAVNAKVAAFYQTVLGRNSIDDAGAPVVSTINYGQSFQNAFWSGQMMVYGNGDQHVFVDFWKAPDVICHEITHGFTDHASRLVYQGESGAVNESISDCFAAAFVQWLARMPASDPAGWQLGSAILGPEATAKGYTCLRDMVTPTASHCLAPQRSIYPNVMPDDDVHVASGVPSRAFALFARALNGNSYDTPIKIWYAACIDTVRLSTTASISDFATVTMHAAGAWTGDDRDAAIAALQDAWKAVEVPIA